MHLVGILFPHINDGARSKSHQKSQVTVYQETQRIVMVKVEVQFPLEQVTKVKGEGGVRSIDYSSLNLCAGWSTLRPDCFTPGKETRYPLYRRLGGPQGGSGRMRKISPPREFDPRTVQTVTSRYTD